MGTSWALHTGAVRAQATSAGVSCPPWVLECPASQQLQGSPVQGRRKGRPRLPVLTGQLLAWLTQCLPSLKWEEQGHSGWRLSWSLSPFPSQWGGGLCQPCTGGAAWGPRQPCQLGSVKPRSERCALVAFDDEVGVHHGFYC